MSVSLSIKNQIAEILIENPPVNALSQSVREGLVNCVKSAQADNQVKAIILFCAGQTFVSGADIKEFSKPPMEPFLPDVLNQIEQSEKPVVAALFGTVLGGGLELALACHYRVALRGTKIGLPEVTLGLIPGAGGTQRLPRLAGLETALEMITSGKIVSVESGTARSVVNAVVDDDLYAKAIDFALGLSSAGFPRACHQALALDKSQKNVYADWRTKAEKKMRGQLAPLRAIDAIEYGQKNGFAEGLLKERELFILCKQSSQSIAMRHAFFAERLSSKVDGLDPALQPQTINKMGVIGAGTMGGGIAMCFASAGIEVQLLELAEENLQRGVQMIDDKYQRSVDSGRINMAEKDACMARIQGTTSYDDFADVDLVVEAAFENMQVKHEIFIKLDEICKPTAILSTNTSYLDIDKIASVTDRPNKVIGMHFFSPAHVMKLLEVVRAAETDDVTLATAMSVGKKIGKLCCAVNVCYGFVGNRMYSAYGREVNTLLMEGATPSQIDNAMTSWGMAMGPVSVTDLTGIDIGYKARKENPVKNQDPLFFRASDLMVENNRLGQKTSTGFYQYVDGVKQYDPEVEILLRAEAENLNVIQKKITNEEIQERLILTLINEGAKILEEGIASRASDIDVIWLNGYGFPRWRGGPMWYANKMGLDNIYQKLLEYQQQFGENYWTPAPLLKQLAGEDKVF